LPVPQRFAEKTMEMFAALDDVDEVMRALREDGSLYPATPGVAASHYVKIGELFSCYKIWLDHNGTQQMRRDQLGPKQFNTRLQSLGYEIVRSNGTRIVGWCLGDTRTTNIARFS
jgi:hypothetical protein